MLDRVPQFNPDQPWLSNANTSLFLKRAEGALDCALQPIVDINSGRTIAFESLVRHTDRVGFPAPESMFDHAASHGVLLELESLLFAKAIAKYVQARATRWAQLFLNLDGRLISQCKQVEATLARLLRTHGIAHTDLCLELSERNQTLGTADFEIAVAGLRRAGFSVAIDDFGTGNSGLQMLYQCSPDFLKIDRFFISSVQTDPKKRLLVSSIVGMAHTLGLHVIAEGIETTAELQSCRGIGCDLAQGYYVSKPVLDVTELKDTYGSIAGQSNKRRRSISSRDIRPLLQPLACLSINSPLLAIFDVLRDHPTQTIIPVLDPAGTPKGVIREKDVKSFIYSSFGRDLLRNTSLGFNVQHFICPVATADINSQLGPLLELAEKESNDGIVITDEMRYCGFLTTTGLLKLSNDVRLHEASDRNPLTGLPGNPAIRRHLDEIAEHNDTRRLICLFDLDHFKPFNDKYGFRVGDRALTFLAVILKSMQLPRDIFIGHIGGDDFFLAATGEHCETVLNALPGIRRRFAREAESLYTAEDRKAGVIVGKNREGKVQAFPLLTCSIAVIELGPGTVAPGSEILASHLARLKSQAKAIDGGIATEALATQSVQVGILANVA